MSFTRSSPSWLSRRRDTASYSYSPCCALVVDFTCHSISGADSALATSSASPVLPVPAPALPPPRPAFPKRRPLRLAPRVARALGVVGRDVAGRAFETHLQKPS